MLWFYLIEESHQPFCMTELTPLFKWNDSKTKLVPDPVSTSISSKYLSSDLAIGFDQGFVKIYDISHHFQNTKVDEVNKIGLQIPG